MITKRIHDFNAFPGAPSDWEPDLVGQCHHLAVRVTTRAENGQLMVPRRAPGGALAGKTVVYCESAWEPTPDEMAALQEGGQIVLRVYGWQPPVMLYVERPARALDGSS